MRKRASCALAEKKRKPLRTSGIRGKKKRSHCFHVNEKEVKSCSKETSRGRDCVKLDPGRRKNGRSISRSKGKAIFTET